MPKFKVSANPKGGTCYQFVEADTEEEAIEKAKANPNRWLSPNLKNGMADWFFRAHERQPRT